MQKCGQLHASIAVALIAQSVAGDVVWPAETPSRAITISNGTLRIRVTSFSSDEIINLKNVLRKTKFFRAERQFWTSIHRGVTWVIF